MTVNEFIKQKFQPFGVQLSEADLFEICVSNSLEGGEEVTADNFRRVSIAIVQFIPSLLVNPTSVSEGGFSISRASSEDIKTYHSIQCKELGLKNPLNPKITFR